MNRGDSTAQPLPPDTNVGVGGGRPRGSGWLVRASALARLVLFRGLATLLPLSLSLLTSGCVIPVAPDFQDPPLEPNFPPTVKATGPVNFGTLVNIVATPTNPIASANFEATVSDQNPGDHIWVQWIFDNTQPFNGAISHAIPAMDVGPTNGNPLAISLLVSCNLGLVMNSTSLHQLLLIVSDRQPVEGGAFEDITSPGFAAFGGWPFYMPCDGSSTGTP